LDICKFQKTLCSRNSGNSAEAKYIDDSLV
jgi:hypothetical protein